MKFGLALNVNETTLEVQAKSQQAERCGLDYVWISDRPSQRHAPVVTSAVSSATNHIRIGLGLISPFLHTPQQIASSLTTLIESYGARFDLCIGPGDREELRRVGVYLDNIHDLPNLLLSSKEEISKALRKRKLEPKIWLGAQGPKLLRTASSFDGVLLNYSSPEMVQWALETIQEAKGSVPELVGVFAPSYIYRDLNPEIHKILRFASATVALGASDDVLEKFSLLKSLEPARRELQKRPLDKSILELIPSHVIDKFSIFKRQDELPQYIEQLKRLGVKHIVFSYPQSYSAKTTEELSEALTNQRVNT